MSPVEFLGQRRSVPSKLLGEPGPDDVQLRELLTLAVRVPDHGKLEPWRFVRIAGEARHALGAKLVALRLARDAGTEPTALDKDRARFTHAPLVLAVIGRILPGHKIPEQEQILSAGCVCFNLLLGAQALGYGAQWLTGWPAYDRGLAGAFGLQPHERIVGFVHIGTPQGEMPERPRPDPLALLSDVIL